MPKFDPTQFVMMKGMVDYVNPGEKLVGVSYGIERYYVQENTGGQYDASDHLVAQVAVDSFGHSVLKTLSNGKPHQQR